MPVPTAKPLCAFWTMFLLSLQHSDAGEIRISFLQDTNSLRDTIKLLTDSGCTKEGTLFFGDRVRQYFEEPFDFDLSRFPQPTNGSYHFGSPRELVAAFTNGLATSKHSPDFTCIDLVVALAHLQLVTSLHPDDIVVGPITVTECSTNWRVQTLRPAGTPRGAFTFMRPPGTPETGYPVFPDSMRDERICLEPLVLRWYPLPNSTDEKRLAPEVLNVLRRNWQLEALRFPTRFELVLLHNVIRSAHWVNTCHAALLFGHKQGFTYIEKAGTRGPFIRLDLVQRSDLISWLSVPFAVYDDPKIRHFATLNDDSVYEISLK